MRVVIGTYRITAGGRLEDGTRLVQFDGELLARHSWRTEDGGIRQRLFKTDAGRYIVSVAIWTPGPREATTYTLREVGKADLLDGGEFEALGRAAFGEVLDLDAALSIEEALRILEEQL